MKVKIDAIHLLRDTDGNLEQIRIHTISEGKTSTFSANLDGGYGDERFSIEKGLRELSWSLFEYAKAGAFVPDPERGSL